MNLSIIIPAYNERENIRITIEELLRITKSILCIKNLQIIVVDDNSNDDTYEVASKIDPARILCLRLSKRSGSHVALRAGLRSAKGDVALCISADGQDDPNCLETMLDKWRKEAKVVWALRNNRDNETWHYRKMAQIYYWMLSWLNGNKNSFIDQSCADFFLLDRIAIDAINACSERNTHIFGLIEWLGFPQDSVRYERRIRRFGKPKWNYRGRLHVGKEWIIAFSGLPLKLMIIVGFVTALIGLLYAVYLFIYAFIAKPAPGWSSIMVAILVLGGVQMLMLGIIGEYLWNNLEETRKRPLYFIEKESNDNPK